MEPTEQLTSEQRDNLVAYLDGELDEGATEKIERTLAHSAGARHEVEMLTRTWELLDVLPKPKASEEFTERTLSTISIEEVRQSGTGGLLLFARKLGLLPFVWGLGLVFAATAGYSASRYWITDDSEQIVKDLPVVEQYDDYSDISDIEFLRGLQESGIFDEELKKKNEN